MGDGCISWGQPGPIARGWDPSTPQFWGSLYANTYGEGIVFGESATPLTQGGSVPAHPNFGGSFMRTLCVAELPNMT